MKKRIDSFKYAFRGVRDGVREQANLRIHIVAAAVAILLGFVLHISSLEWCVILLCIGAVISLELLNTAIERLCDFVEPRLNEKIRIIKDISAASVLAASVVSLIIGTIIFGPKITALAVFLNMRT